MKNPTPRGFRRSSSTGALSLIASLALPAHSAPNGAPTPSARAVLLFTIAKSQNKNQVQYAVHVDEQCAPIARAPVFAYWRMLEQGGSRVAPILPREVSAYGVAQQAVTAYGANSGGIRVVLNALPRRPIDVETRRGSDGVCKAFAALTIAGQPAHLFNVYVKLKWLLGVDYLVLRGWAKDGVHVLREKLDD